MTREQAINYLFSSGFTNEQVCDVVRALTYEPTTKNDPKFCPDRKAKTTNMETILHCIENECAAYKDGKCLKYNSDQEPTINNDLGVEEVTALAEWTARLTKASEDAYNKGYADGMNDQEFILDKIRAEIEQARYGLVNDGLDIALNIIDKYKAETR